MQALHVELFLALQFNKPHCRPGRGLRNRLGVPVVIPLRLNVTAHILRRHQAHFVPLIEQHASEVV